MAVKCISIHLTAIIIICYTISVQPLIYYIHKPAGELLRHIYILIIQYMTPNKKLLNIP